MLRDRVKSTVVNGGTGALTVGGPGSVPGYRSLFDLWGYHFPYLIEDGDDWEIGIGFMTSFDTMQRAIDGSSTGSLLDVTTQATVSLAAIARTGIDPGNGTCALVDAINYQGGTDAVGILSTSPSTRTIGIGRGADPTQPGQVMLRPGAIPESIDTARDWWMTLAGATADATPKVLAVNDAGTRPHLWGGYRTAFLTLRVVAAALDGPRSAYAVEIRAAARNDSGAGDGGLVDPATATELARDPGFIGGATLAVSTTGEIEITVTGQAAADIRWAVYLHVVSIQA
jgi:hypothetical protein